MLGANLLDLLDGGDASELVDTIALALGATPPKALERAAALLVWKRTWESAQPASRHGGNRRSASYKTADQNEKISFCSMAAEAIGIGERSVQLDVALAEQLGTTDIRQLWTSPIRDNAAALRTVAALDTTARQSLFVVWKDTPELAFSLAMRAAQLRKEQDSEQAQFAKMLDAWQRGSSRARRRFLTELGLNDAAADRLVAKWRKSGAGQ